MIYRVENKEEFDAIDHMFNLTIDTGQNNRISIKDFVSNVGIKELEIQKKENIIVLAGTHKFKNGLNFKFPFPITELNMINGIIEIFVDCSSISTKGIDWMVFQIVLEP